MTDLERIESKLDEILCMLKESRALRRNSSEIDAMVKGKIIDLKNRRERRKKGHGGAPSRS